MTSSRAEHGAACRHASLTKGLLLQNADDAGARTVSFCLDERQHGTASLAYAGLAPLQGPALLVRNDAAFSAADFESISRIGDSVKRVQAGKTGRYGIGFSACYHLTGGWTSFWEFQRHSWELLLVAWLLGLAASIPGCRVLPQHEPREQRTLND